MVTAIYPGSFDPITNGHYEVLLRASMLFDKVIVVILTNKEKNPFLSTEKRKELIRESVKNIENIEIDSYEGLTVEYAAQKGAQVLIRGLRAVSDFEYEMQMAQTNKSLNSDIDTIFLVPSVENNFVSSSIVKEIAQFGGDISGLVPEPIQEYFEKYKEIRK